MCWKHWTKHLTFVWMQSIGLPTYCLVVTITENVSRITDDMHLKTVRTCQHRFKLWIIYCYQWSLNTELSMWMWETLMRVFNLRNMSSMMRFLFLKIIQHDLRFLWWDNKYLTLIKGCKHVAVCVFGRVSQLRRGWQVIKICACEIWEETDSGSNVGY